MSNGDDSYSSCDYINLAYDPANSDKSAKALIYALRPDWESRRKKEEALGDNNAKGED